MPKIPMGKTRSLEQPWLIIESRDGWTWKVLQAHRKDPNKQYASWFCSVSSPFTYGGADMGDTYIADIVLGGGVITFRDPEVPDSAIPQGLLDRGTPDALGNLIEQMAGVRR